MPGPNDEIFDATIRRAIFVERLSTRQARELEKFLREVRIDLEDRIRRYAGSNLRKSVILDRQLARLDELITDVYGRLKKDIRQKQRDLARLEAKWQNGKLAGIGVEVQQITSAQVYGAMLSRPAEGAFVSEMVSDLPRAHKARLTRALRISYVEGEAQSTAISRIRQVTGQNYRGAEYLVRTANAHISAVAEMEHARSNKQLYDRYQWSSILDRRTTPICQARDGMIYPIGPGGEYEGPVPPAHGRCRSHIISLLKGEGDPDRKSYQEWLKGQSAPVQNEVLGPARGKLFRSGKFTVQTFVDNKGKLIRLDELAK